MKLKWLTLGFCKTLVACVCMVKPSLQSQEVHVICPSSLLSWVERLGICFSRSLHLLTINFSLPLWGLVIICGIVSPSSFTSIHSGCTWKASLFFSALVPDETGEDHCGASPLRHAELWLPHFPWCCWNYISLWSIFFFCPDLTSNLFPNQRGAELGSCSRYEHLYLRRKSVR